MLLLLTISTRSKLKNRKQEMSQHVFAASMCFVLTVFNFRMATDPARLAECPLVKVQKDMNIGVMA